MAKITYQNLPSTATPLNATNLNTMQEHSFIKHADLSVAGWYRIAKITGDNGVMLYIQTSYANDIPITMHLSVLTNYRSAKISLLNENQFTTNDPAISQIRIQEDTQNEIYYVDVYYRVNNINPVFVRNESLIDESKVEILTPTAVSTSYTTLDTINVQGLYYIGNEDDLNNFLTAGCYTIGTTNPANNPRGSAFTGLLVVFQSFYRGQLIICSDYYYNVYVRFYDGNSWGSWRTLI